MFPIISLDTICKTFFLTLQMFYDAISQNQVIFMTCFTTYAIVLFLIEGLGNLLITVMSDPVATRGTRV